MRPQIFWCLDDQGERARWVLKLEGRSDTELAADWIGCILALKLGIPCPAVDICDVSGEALSTAPLDVQEWARPGPAFASRELTLSVAAQTDDDVLRFASAEFLGSVFALDSWLEILDRKKPDGIWNLLIPMDAYGHDTGHTMVLDFGKGLTSCMLPVFGEPVRLVPGYPLAIRRAASIAEAVHVANEIAKFTYDDIRQIVGSVPGTWIDNSARDRIVTHLTENMIGLHDLCQQLHDLEPRWN
jgi:hypothetical protein